jgi:nucleotide-binding universal stress UspA family protein
VEIAERAGAELLLVHVADLEAAPGEPGSLIPPLYIDHPQHDWPAWTSEFVRRFASLCLHGHVHVRFRLAYGDPTSVVLRLAKEQSADLLLLAWRGVLDEPRAAILKTLVAEARCPVMVIRA